MKKLISVLLCISCLATLCSCSRGLQRYTADFTGMFDTVSTVVAYDTSQSAFDAHLAQFKAALQTYDRLYDIYHSYEGVTNLKDINATAGKAPVAADKKIMDLLSFGKEVYALSEGKTNICLGAVLALWHTARETNTLPDDAALAAAAEHTSIDDLVLDTKAQTVFFADKKLQLDVGAIAKGYAAQQVADYAQKELWCAATFSVGGNVCTYGTKNDDGKTLWNIQVEHPDESASAPLETLHLANRSVVTSGDYQRYFEVNGKRYCHIIRPDTLYPSDYMHSVTVVCKDAALADALSTTLFNMSVEEGQALINKTDGVEAVWVDMHFHKTYSKGFAAYLY